MSESKRETLATFQDRAIFKGIEKRKCMFKTANCPDRCEHETQFAKFEVVEHLAYEKPGQYGDKQVDSFTFGIKEVRKNNPQIAQELIEMEAGDEVTICWKHDYVTRDGSTAPERFPTSIVYEDDDEDSSLDDEAALAQALGKAQIDVKPPIAKAGDAPIVGVVKETISEGDGQTYPQKGDKLSMHYTGTLLSNGKKFDSSRDRGQLFDFTIGVGQVIKGWDEGVMKMSLGERANLKIASEFGYGARGAGSDIPPNADLCFDVELVKINGKRIFTSEDLQNFQDKLDAWKAKKLAKYDENDKFRKARNKKHVNRAGYEKWLTAEVDSGMAEHNK